MTSIPLRARRLLSCISHDILLLRYFLRLGVLDDRYPSMMLNGSLPVKRRVVLYRPLWTLYRWRARRNYLKSNPSLLVNILPHEITSTETRGKLYPVRMYRVGHFIELGENLFFIMMKSCF